MLKSVQDKDKFNEIRSPTNGNTYGYKSGLSECDRVDTAISIYSVLLCAHVKALPHLVQRYLDLLDESHSTCTATSTVVVSESSVT